MIFTLIIFAATYLFVAIGHVPGLRLDRAGAALLGASLMVASGAISPEDAFAAINLDTLALLLGMMIVVANLRLAGFFALAHGWIVRRARRPLILLVGIAVMSGGLSAFLVNDTVCLMLTPLVVATLRSLKRDPVPYLLVLAAASNIGSTATITGNPQNMMIGGFSHIPYIQFAASLAPVAAIGLVLTVLIVAVSWRREFFSPIKFETEAPAERWNRSLLLKSLAVTAAIVVAFFFGVRPSLAALLGGSVLFVTRRIRPERVYREIDWSLLLLFAGLFVVVAAFQKAVIGPEALRVVESIGLDRTPVLAFVTAALSNLVSNVPAVLVLKPFIENLADPAHSWLVLAMAATLAGNLTILGSVANLIVVEGAEKARIRIGFWRHLAIGAPLTILTIAIGVAFLSR